MMVEEIVDTLERELRCVRHKSKGACDGNCKGCEYINNPEALMDALSIAVIKLRRMR